MFPPLERSIPGHLAGNGPDGQLHDLGGDGVNIGLLGAGRIGALHAQTLVRHPAISRLLVFDPIVARSTELAATVDADVAGSVEELLAAVDAVFIASSTDSHAGFLVQAARAGLPVFCEKPIASDLESTDRAIEAVDRAGIPVLMGFNRRFDAGFQRARAVVADGTLGQLMLVVGHHHDHRPPPEEYIPVSGGQYKDQLIHDFDLLRFVTGDEVVAVHAAGSSVGLEMVAKYADTAVSIVTLWLRSGAMAVLCGARQDPVGYDVRMEVFGTGDSIAVGMDDRTPIRSLEAGGHDPVDPYREWLARFGASYQTEVDAFVSMVRGEIDSPCTVYDARAALSIAEACSRSLSKGGPVEVRAA